MKDMKPFQLIFIAICLVLGVGGMLVFSFAGTKPRAGGATGAQVVIWGTLPEDPFKKAIESQNTRQLVTLNAVYVQKDPATFSQDLLEALVENKGPDVILVPIEDALSYRSKISTIPFTSLTERSFKDSFIQEGELLHFHDGYLGVPFVVDPLVLYWNRDMFTAHNLSLPPTTWEKIVSLTPLLSDVTTNLTVNKSAIALGDYRNITNAKNIFSALLLQSGTSITTLDNFEQDIDLLNAKIDKAASPVSFYTQFANPSDKSYTWNRSLPSSLNMFIGNNLAMYIGFGSEAKDIQTKNPNLNFDMSLFPQFEVIQNPITYGKLYSFFVLSASKNPIDAIQALSSITGKDFMSEYIQTTDLAPARRDLLSQTGTDPYSPLIYKSALYAQAWLDPNPVATNTIFQTMVESVLAGREDVGGVVSSAANQLIQVVKDYNQKFKK